MNVLASGIGHEAISQNGTAPSRVVPAPSDGDMGVRVGGRHEPHDLGADALLRVPEAVRRLRGTFLEMPGTQLSLEDASRLVSLPPSLCAQVLDTLVDVRFLRCGRDGVYTANGDESRAGGA